MVHRTRGMLGAPSSPAHIANLVLRKNNYAVTHEGFGKDHANKHMPADVYAPRHSPHYVRWHSSDGTDGRREYITKFHNRICVANW